MQSARAQAAALHRASGGRLARADHALLQLQRQYGNRYVQRVISHARKATNPKAAPVVQAKLVLGPANDRYEQEADRVAEGAVGYVASHDPAAQRQAGEDKDALLLRQPDIQQPYGAGGGAVDAPVAQALQRARGGGQPLPATLRWSMEQALGADFGEVRVHTGARSDRLNRSLQATAFTSGQDIFFRRGAYPPASPRGAALLAHELTHVVQQRNLRRNTVQRYFDPPPQPSQRVMKLTNPLGVMQKTPHLSRTAGWAISKEVVPAQELLVTGRTRVGHKVTRFTALLTPGHVNLGAGAPTQQGSNPLGWDWVEQNEVRSANRGALRYWVRFHLLNAKLGGKGTSERHLVPTTKSANARWDVGIERPLAAALNGAAGTPVYYDVKLTYWNTADAPSTYRDATTNTDYSPNITLFPQWIEGNWQRFEKARWVAQTPLTVTVDKPRGIRGEEAELTTHQNLKLLANLFHIDENILRLLQWTSHTTPIATYGDVRHILEVWAMNGDTPKEISGRQQAIFASDSYLRDVLAGRQSFKLKINNQHIPDDATPEAKMYGPPVQARSYLDLSIYEKVEGPITTAYMMAQNARSGAVEYFPPFEEFLWLLTTKGPLYPVKLAGVQQQWDDFKAANELLPPMRGMYLVPEQDEILVVLQRRTQPLVVEWLRGTFTEQVRGLTGVTGTIAVADELAQAVAANYGQLLRRRFHALTVEHADKVPKLAQALLEEDPVRPLAAELTARLAAARDMMNLSIAGTLPSHPFITSLTVPMAGLMGQRVADEQQRRMAAMPRPMPPPQPTQAPPTRRHPIPAGRPGSPRRLQPGTSTILKPGSKTHEYNQRVIRALRAAVLEDPRYPADQAARQEIWRLMKQVEQRWTSPTRVAGKPTLNEDVEHALAHVFRGRR